MRKATSFIGVLIIFILIGGHASAKLMRPVKRYDTTVSGIITVGQVDGKSIYYLTDKENNRVYTLGNRNGELKEEFIDILREAFEKDMPVRITGELSVWKDRVLSLEIKEVRYVAE